MYGISSKVTTAPEDDFSKAMEFISNAAIAIEQLVEIQSKPRNTSNNNITIVNNVINQYREVIGFESIALEDIGDNVSNFVKATSEVIKKLIAYVKNAVEFVVQTISSHRRTALNIKNKAVAVIGEADTISIGDVSGEIEKLIKAVPIYFTLNIRGNVPSDIHTYVLRELKLCRELAKVDYAGMITTMVKGMRNGAVQDDDKEKLLSELSKSCETNLTKIQGSSEFDVKIDSSCDYYHSEISPGNVALIVSVPKIIKEFSKYSAVIKPTKKLWKTTNGTSKVLPKSSILELSRAIKIFCDEVIKNDSNQKSIEKASREINLAFRKGSNSEVAALVKDFASLTRNPHLTHTRMTLTLCTRALRYCQASIDVYNKKSGIE